jgi:hypothetical protein
MLFFLYTNFRQIRNMTGDRWSPLQRFRMVCDKLKFEVSTAVLVELTTQGAIDAEPGS